MCARQSRHPIMCAVVVPAVGHRLPVILTLALLLGVIPVSAQERLFLFVDATASLLELDTSDAHLGAVKQVAHFPSDTRAVPIAGGRYFLLQFPWWDRPSAVAVFDTHAFTSGVVAEWTFASQVIFEPDEFEPRIFYRTRTEVGVIEPPRFVPRVLRTGSDIDVDRGTLSGAPLEYAHVSRTLFFTRSSYAVPSHIIAVDADTGALRGTIAIDGDVLSIEVDNTAGTLIVPIYAPRASTTRIETYALDTLVPISRTVQYRLHAGVWNRDPARAQILGGVESGHFSPYGAPWAFSVDAVTLAPKAFVEFSALRLNPPVASLMELMPSSTRNRIFAVIGRPDYEMYDCRSAFCNPGSMFVVSLDGETLQPLATVDLVSSRAAVASYGQAILLTPPLSPAPLTLNLAGRHATLTWINPGDTIDFVIEVGTLPGRSNIGIFHVGNVTSFASDVPPGTYYVRVRALNDVGASLPSNEVVIRVP